MRRASIIVYLFACVIIGAGGDALFDGGNKIWGHFFDALEAGLLISGALVLNLRRRDWIAFFLAYVFIRVASFDYVYNLVRGLPIMYLGDTGWWDKFLIQFPSHGVTFARMIFLITGIAIPIKHL